MKKLLFFLLLLISVFSFSQEKFEKEYKVNESQLPTKALAFINKVGFKNKIKWYAEESNDGKTFEAKTVHLGYLYSIEFNMNGDLIDIEQKVNFKSLSQEIKKTITSNLNNKFVKFRIKKTQIQFKGVKAEMLKIFNNNNAKKKEVELFYELIVKGKTNESSSLYEVLFSELGNVVKVLKFKPINSINLEF